MRLLLDRGADYRTIDAFGEGILHWLAGSGLDMLRLFKGIGISGVDVERRDNRGKTAMEILEGRWDLTEEFRREFLDLVDGIGEGPVEPHDDKERDGLARTDDADVATSDAEDVDQVEDDVLSGDEFFDALDDSKTTTFTPTTDEKEPVSSNRNSSQSDLDGYQSTGTDSSSTEALSSTLRDRQDLHHDGDRHITHDEEALPDEADNAGDRSIQTDEPDDKESSQCGLDGANDLVHGGDAEQGDSKKPRIAQTDADKVFINEAGLKFRGMSTAYRSR